MLEILKAPFPFEFDNDRKKVISALLAGLFVGLFLFIFKPFGIAETITESSNYFKFVGFAVVTFLGVLLVDLGFPYLFPKFFDERYYTVWKELIVGALVILIIGLGNTLYLKFFYAFDLGFKGLAIMIGQTFLVGIFPISLLTLLKLIKLQKSNLIVSQEINSNPDFKAIAGLKTNDWKLSVDSRSNAISIDAEFSGLVYIESVGNYINVIKRDDKELSKKMLRKTLKSVAEEKLGPSIIRCHRSYIVNLEKVTHVSGNAQGLKLTLEGCEEKIPVSRKYISIVKEHLMSNYPTKG